MRVYKQTQKYRYSADFMLPNSGFVVHKLLLPWQPFSNGDATKQNNEPLNYSGHYQCMSSYPIHF